MAKHFLTNPTKLIASLAIMTCLCLLFLSSNYTISEAKAAYTVTDDTAIMAALDNHIQDIYYGSGLQNKGLSYNVFKFAITGYYNMQREGTGNVRNKKIAIIDYTKPSGEKRFYLVDVPNRSVLHYTWVAHGKNSGLVYARRFSNQHNSYKSSLGFYKAESTYYGNFGYSLRLEGLESGFNSNAKSRAIVMHGAPYVGDSFVRKHGRVGHSWGCPALPLEENRQIIDHIKSGGSIFAYSGDMSYLNTSQYLNFYKAARYYYKSNGW